MSDHLTREQRVLYDHEDPEAPTRRPADDWGIDESFPRVRGRRFARAHEGPPRGVGTLMVVQDPVLPGQVI